MNRSRFLLFIFATILFNQVTFAVPAMAQLQSKSAFTQFRTTLADYARMPYRDTKFLYSWAVKKINKQSTTKQEDKLAHKIMT